MTDKKGIKMTITIIIRIIYPFFSCQKEMFLSEIERNAGKNKMTRTPVDSSNISSIGYDEASSTFEIEFHGGAVYQYFDVPEYIHEAFINASSHGKYFQKNIRGNYQFQKISK